MRKSIEEIRSFSVSQHFFQIARHGQKVKEAWDWVLVDGLFISLVTLLDCVTFLNIAVISRFGLNNLLSGLGLGYFKIF